MSDETRLSQGATTEYGRDRRAVKAASRSEQAAEADNQETGVLSETRERLARVAAELNDFRKRSRRELEEQRRYAALPLLQDLLPVMDNLRHALDAAEIASDPNGMLCGVRIIYNQLNDVMQRHDCQEIAAVGVPFDPEAHEAIRQVPGEPPGMVVDVVQPGYRLHDRMVRPAKVVVSSAAEEGSGRQHAEQRL